MANSYRIVGNFHIFIVFVTALTDTKFSTPRKFATVGKGRLVKVAVSVRAINCGQTHGILPPIC